MMKQLLLIGILMLTLESCSFQVEKINIGKDQCHFCKMTIADVHYGGAILTTKGKTYKFDDMYCVKSFIKSGFLDKKVIKTIYIQNYNGNNELIDIRSAYIIESPSLNGPMNGKWIGFVSKVAYSPLDKALQGTSVSSAKFSE